MKPSDALDLVTLTLERWTSWKPTAEQMERFADDILDLDAGTARAALDAIHREGDGWAPTSGDLRRRVALLELDPPEWVDVKRQLIERHYALQTFEPPPWECPHGKCGGDGWREVEPNTYGRCECYEARKDATRMAESLHLLVREFIRDNYVTWAEVEAVGAGAGTKDAATLESQMRVKWERFAARAVESRAIASIANQPELPRLEAARAEDAPRKREAIRRGELKGFGAIAALPAAPGPPIVDTPAEEPATVER